MSNKFDWHGEYAIFGGYIGITSFSINSINDLPDGRKHATGQIEIVDHAEHGFPGEDPWESFGKKQAGGAYLWETGRTDTPEAFFRNSTTGKPGFTQNQDVNAEMIIFINRNLDAFLNPGTSFPQDGPQHEMAKTAVAVPTVIKHELMIGGGTVKSVFIQWFGKCGSNKMPEDAQFFFDTEHNQDDPIWGGDIASFKVIFIGQIQHWPNPEDVDDILEFADGRLAPTTNIVWLMSPISSRPGRPSSPMMGVVILGDGVCGLIEPKLYCDLAVKENILKEVKDGLSLSDRLIIDPSMELPPEAIPWTSNWEPCEVCKSFEHSHESAPACPPGGSCNDFSYLCTCGRRWWQYNDAFHLWKHVTAPNEWDAVRREQIFKDAGFEPFE